MKRNTLLIISIIIAILSFINGWYQDYLISNTFLIAIIPNFILIIAEIVCSIIALIKLNKTKGKITGHPIASIEKIKDNWYFVETEY